MIPIVACTIGSPTVAVLKASAEAYAPDHPLLIHSGPPSTFGDAYNQAMEEAYKTYDEIIVANDDVVLTPTTMKILLEDVAELKKVVDKIGFVATMADNARPVQNVRFRFGDEDEIKFGRWPSESLIKQVPVIAPIFAWYSKKAFEVVKFPPITWWSDDIICDDLEKAGFKNFISRSYVHHVGSNTVGKNYDKLANEALPWVKANRANFLKELENRRYAPGEARP